MKYLISLLVLSFVFSTAAFADRVISNISVEADESKYIVYVTTAKAGSAVSLNGSIMIKANLTGVENVVIDPMTLNEIKDNSSTVPQAGEAFFGVVTADGAYGCEVKERDNKRVYDLLVSAAKGDLLPRFAIVINADEVCDSVGVVLEVFTPGFEPPADDSPEVK